MLRLLCGALLALPACAAMAQTTSPGQSGATTQSASPAQSGSASQSGSTPQSARNAPGATPPSAAGAGAGAQESTQSGQAQNGQAGQAAPAGQTAQAGQAGQGQQAQAQPVALPPAGTWYTFNGDLQAQKFAPETQITPANVKHLRPAWVVHTGDVSSGGKIPATTWSGTPLFVNNTVYVGTPFYRILAINPGTGHIKWSFNPHAELKALTQPEMKNRGIAYWQAAHPVAGEACQKIVYIGTMAGKIWAVDADTGKPCQNFGDKGMLNVNQWNPLPKEFPLSQLQGPTVFGNTLFFGWCGADWVYKIAPPGIVFAVDAQTGKLQWTFRPLTPKMKLGTGKVNVWASMSVDPQHHLLYIPTSPPSPDDYGGDRKEPIPYGNALIALNTDTGKVVWSRQFVHHGLWDYDISTAPTLFDMHRDGKTIPALVEPTKQGFIFVLNRLNGDPLFPITEEKVPQSTVPGEQSSPTQPEETIPKPTTTAQWPGVFGLANAVSIGNCGSRAAHLVNEGRFTPPSLQGSLVYPPSTGGVEWGGGAIDPENNTFVVNSSNVVYIYKMLTRAEYNADKKKGLTQADGYYPQKGARYGVYLSEFSNWLGMPCWNPPYGTISAYDMNTGKMLWRHPFGEVQRYGFYMPYSWGSVTIGAPVITKSGLIFIGGSMDSRVRALDLKTGKVLWKWLVDAPAVAMPAVYMWKGKEYVVFAAGGNAILTPRVSDQLIAFALPHPSGAH